MIPKKTHSQKLSAVSSWHFPLLSDRQGEILTIHTWLWLSECKFKPQQSSGRQTSAVFRVGQSLALTLILSPLAVSQSLSHRLRPPWRWPPRTSPSFVHILFHASSFSRYVLIHHLTHTDTPTHHPYRRRPLPLSSRYSLQWAPVMTHSAVTQHFIRLHLASITSSPSAPPPRHFRGTPTSISHVLFHNSVMPHWRSAS